MRSVGKRPCGAVRIVASSRHDEPRPGPQALRAFRHSVLDNPRPVVCLVDSKLLVGPVTSGRRVQLWTGKWPSSGPGSFLREIDALVDCGRDPRPVRSGQQAILQGRGPRGGGHTAQMGRHWRMPRRTLDARSEICEEPSISFVVVGPDPVHGSRKSNTSFRPRFLGAIPHDAKSAAMACGSPGRPGRFARSNLVSCGETESRRSAVDCARESAKTLDAEQWSTELTMSTVFLIVQHRLSAPLDWRHLKSWERTSDEND